MGEIKFDDRLMEEIACCISDRILEDFDSRPKADDGYTPSEKFRKAAEDIVNSRKRTSKITVRTIFLIAAVLATLVLFAVGTSANRNAKTRLQISGNSRYIDIEYDDYEAIREEAPKYIKEVREPSFIPEGFEETMRTDEPLYIGVDYFRGEDFIYFGQYTISTQVSIHPGEDGRGEVSINGSIGTYSCDDRVTSIVWEDGEYLYIIDSSLDLRTIIDIAESVE